MAEVILLSEGPDDQRVLEPVLCSMSPGLKEAIGSGALGFDNLAGASALVQKASFYLTGACKIHCFLDNDSAGKDAFKKALAQGVWALKVSGLESLQMSELAKAAKWAEMESYYKLEAMNVQLLIRQGSSGYDAYIRASKLNEDNLKLVLEPEMLRRSEHAQNFERLASVCQEISSVIIGTAKAP